MHHIGVRAIAGRLMLIRGDWRCDSSSTEPGYLDLQIASPDAIRILILMVIMHDVMRKLRCDHDYRLEAGKMGRLSTTGCSSCRQNRIPELWLSAESPSEPIVHYGPFVMNTMAEIKQAVTDYNSKLV